MKLDEKNIYISDHRHFGMKAIRLLLFLLCFYIRFEKDNTVLSFVTEFCHSSFPIRN